MYLKKKNLAQRNKHIIFIRLRHVVAVVL